MTEPVGRLLIVDDEAAVVEVLSDYFTAQGYTVHTATSGTEALEAVGRVAPDLVLLDVRMPGMSGVDVLRQIQGTEPRPPVVMVTANEDMALAREMLAIGALDYVAKPFDFHHLDRVVAAGIVHAGSGRPTTVTDHPTGLDDAARRLAFGVFRAVRTMSEAARASTGARLETSALAAWRAITGGDGAAARERLSEMELLVAIASDLGDLPLAARSDVETALTDARKALVQG